MQRQGLIPNNEKNAEIIKQQLAYKKRKGTIQKESDEYFAVTLQEKFIEQVETMGYNKTDAQYFLSEHFLPEYNIDLFV